MLVLGALSLTALVPFAWAWNRDVHNQIGFLAETFLTSQTKAFISTVLEPEYKGSIGRAAAWADSYRGTAEGAYTTTWHYIDSSDSVSGSQSMFQLFADAVP
jgi:S1/P1 Nuclease